MQTKLGPQVYTQQNLPLSPAPILCFLMCSLGDKAITINSRSFSAPQNSEPIQQSLPLPPLPTSSTLKNHLPSWTCRLWAASANGIRVSLDIAEYVSPSHGQIMLYCITHLFMGLWGVCTFGLLMQSTALVLSSQILDFSTVGEK